MYACMYVCIHTPTPTPTYNPPPPPPHTHLARYVEVLGGERAEFLERRPSQRRKEQTLTAVVNIYSKYI